MVGFPVVAVVVVSADSVFSVIEAIRFNSCLIAGAYSSQRLGTTVKILTGRIGYQTFCT